MARSHAEEMADTMGVEDGEEEDFSPEDHDALGHKAMEDLAKYLKDGDYEAAWSCFKDAAEIAENAEEAEEGPEGEDGEEEMPVPGGHGGAGHAALLLMPRGK